MTEALFNEAKRWIPGGVNSPVRAFQSVAGTPIFFTHAKGAYLFDSEGKRYIDYIGSWGAMILGHAHPEVVHAVQTCAARGLSFGAPTLLENKMAATLCQLVPSMQKVRMVNSGTEAAMSAIRLARAYTSRDKIIKCEGGYHGHADALLVKAGSGALTCGVPNSPGVPADLAALTLTLNYNDIAQAKDLFATYGKDIAAVIVEPVAGNMNCVPAHPDFLHGLRTLCDQYHSVLIFDEVMSGFRVALGGAQSIYKIMPDLTILGKIIGSGLPVGAFGGSAEIMDLLSPDGPVYQAGTLSGNPVVMAAGLATLQHIQQDDFFSILQEKSDHLSQGLRAQAKQHGVALTTHAIGGMFGYFFTPLDKICSFADVLSIDQDKFKQFFHHMLAAGIYLAPSPFEAGFISAAHSHDDIECTIAAAATAMAKL